MADPTSSKEISTSPKPAPTEEKPSEPTDKVQDSEPTPSTSTSTTPPEPGTEAQDQSAPTAEPAPPATAWQAIFSPQFNTYYFYNPETQETTWDNPLTATAPAPAASSAPPSTDPTPDPDPAAAPADAGSSTRPYAALHAAALQAGIDPSLAHLDPSLLATLPGAAAGPGPASFTAKFNARTGQFARPDARDPTHLSEHARATRMSEFYFDVKAWEEELARRGGALMGEEGGAEGKKRKRPSKKDLDRFKEQKRLKKIAKTAWLRT